MPLLTSRRLRPGVYALLDGSFVALSWACVYAWRFDQWPVLSRGPLGLIGAWLLTHYLLGTYTALSRRQLDLGRQLRNSVFAALVGFALAVTVTSLRGESLTSTMSRGFLLPVLGFGFLSNYLLRLSQITAHLWQPQEQWLVIVSPGERVVLSQAIENGGCVIPCGIEWRASAGLAALPVQLPQLLGFDGVVVGGDHQPTARDRATLLQWQEQGIRLLSLQGWAEAFLRRVPPELVPEQWAERVEPFSHARSGPASRLKRLGDLLASGLILLVFLPLAFLLRPVIHLDPCIGRHGLLFQRWRLADINRFSALPQLVNVWRGEMSLIGPRPLSPAVTEELELRYPGADLRQWMRPGMTGWGRIAGPPPEEPDAVAWELGRDLYYLRNHSLLLDLRLLLTSLLQLLLPAAWRP